MTTKPSPLCNEHQAKKEWQKTTFEYTEGDVIVRVPNVFAWVCPNDGEASFTPDTVDELIETVGELVKTAKRAQKRRSQLTEYFVAVG